MLYVDLYKSLTTVRETTRDSVQSSFTAYNKTNQKRKNKKEFPEIIFEEDESVKRSRSSSYHKRIAIE
jgi:hypothetical protein